MSAVRFWTFSYHSKYNKKTLASELIATIFMYFTASSICSVAEHPLQRLPCFAFMTYMLAEAGFVLG